MKNGLAKAARVAVEECLAIKRGETVLVITDEPTRRIGHALWEAARVIGTEAIITEMIPREIHGTEPPPAITKMMLEADVIIIPTSKSLSHTQARRNACRAGARCVSLPGITEDSMVQTLIADYQKIARSSKKLAKILTDGSMVHITTISGSDLTFSIKGRPGFADTGLLWSRGAFGNLPAGEACVAPVEGSANGTLVIEGSMAGIGRLKRPVKFFIENGYVNKISDGEDGRRLEVMLEPHGKLGRSVAELGIGTHDRARVTGNILEDEKVKGTIHIAIGDNKSFGGVVSVPIHLDGVILKPSVTIDGQPVLKNGRLLL